MIEQTREIVRKFNSTYKNDILVEPEILLPELQSQRRLPGTDGKAKMSKSLGNCIFLSDDEKTVKQKVMGMYTDPLHVNVSDPGHVEGNMVFTYLDAFCRPDHFARFLPEYQNLDALKDHYRAGGLGDVKCKKFLIKVLEDMLAPIRAERARWAADLPAVYRILKEGTEAAVQTTNRTLAEVTAAMKVNYFADESIIEEWDRWIHQ